MALINTYCFKYMNNKIPLLLILAVIVFGCSKEKSVEFSAESFTEKSLPICNDSNCPEITINYVQVFGDESISENINEEIKKFIIASLSTNEENAPKYRTIEDAATAFIENYRRDKAEFPDMSGEYTAEINVTEIYTTSEIVSFEMRQYLYTGGAHGYGTTAFKNFDPKTGKELKNKDIFNDLNKFKEFAEMRFRKQNNIPNEEPINEAGFWFEDDVFHLPESIGFIKDSLIFVYNQYDIASYADGPIELKIPLEDAKPFLKIN